MAVTADVYMPFDSGPGSNVTEDGWRAMTRYNNIAGVVRSIGSELLPFGDSTGMQVKVSDGRVVIEGYYGQWNATTILPIANNASGSTRIDTVVARVDWTTNNRVELDVIAGTPGVSTGPFPTRDSSKWEIPIALVTVATGAVTISAGNVFDVRQWGGPPVITTTDDFRLWGDRISTCPRFNVSGDAAVVNSNLYVAAMQSPNDQLITKIKLCPSVLPVAGTTTVRIFRGFRYDNLVNFIDPTTSTFLYGGTAGQEHVSAITATTFRAGEYIAIAVAGASTTTAASLAQNAVTFTGNASSFLNPPGTGIWTSAFKTATMPTAINLADGSWTRRDRVFWAALA